MGNKKNETMKKNNLKVNKGLTKQCNNKTKNNNELRM